jgi:hypothetical protein
MPIFIMLSDFWRLDEEPAPLTEDTNPYPGIGTMTHKIDFTLRTDTSVDGGFKWGLGVKETGKSPDDALAIVSTFHRTRAAGASTSTVSIEVPIVYESTDLSFRVYSPNSETAVLALFNVANTVRLTAQTSDTRMSAGAAPRVHPEYVWYRIKKEQRTLGLDSKFSAFVAKLDSTYIGHPLELSTIFANELGPNWARHKSEAIGAAIVASRFRGTFDTYSKSLQIVSGLETVRADNGADLPYTLDLFPAVERYLDRNSHDWTTPFASYSAATGHVPLPAGKVIQICQLVDNIVEKELTAILMEKEVSDAVIVQ